MSFLDLLQEPWFKVLLLGLFMVLLGGAPALWLHMNGLDVHRKLMALLVGGAGCVALAPVVWLISRNL